MKHSWSKHLLRIPTEALEKFGRKATSCNFLRIIPFTVKAMLQTNEEYQSSCVLARNMHFRWRYNANFIDTERKAC